MSLTVHGGIHCQHPLYDNTLINCATPPPPLCLSIWFLMYWSHLQKNNQTGNNWFRLGHDINIFFLISSISSFEFKQNIQKSSFRNHFHQNFDRFDQIIHLLELQIYCSEFDSKLSFVFWSSIFVSSSGLIRIQTSIKRTIVFDSVRRSLHPVKSHFKLLLVLLPTWYCIQSRFSSPGFHLL